MNTGRMMNDGHNEVGTRERKLIWDEENRLLAVVDGLACAHFRLHSAKLKCDLALRSLARKVCCNDGSMEAAMSRTKAQARAVARSFKDPDNYENLQFFYHPDHLGSSGFITNLEGEVVQHIEYVPFGEVFIEERNNVWNTPYLFNAKEFDEETGMYYYGARTMSRG